MPTPIEEYDNNCTLMAVREFTSVSDDALWCAFHRCGWKPDYGTTIGQWTRAARKCGLKFGRSYGPAGHPINLAHVIEKFPRGNYIVQILGHVFCLVDGKVVDRTGVETSMDANVYNVIPVLNAKTKEV